MISNKERKERARIRKKLRNEGLLPLPAKRRNWKKYQKEVMELLEETPLAATYVGMTTVAFANSAHNSNIEKAAIQIVHYSILKQKFYESLPPGASVTAGDIYENVYKKVFSVPEYRKRSEGDDR